jgi:hypothetical protein
MFFTHSRRRRTNGGIDRGDRRGWSLSCSAVQAIRGRRAVRHMPGDHDEFHMKNRILIILAARRSGLIGINAIAR